MASRALTCISHMRNTLNGPVKLKNFKQMSTSVAMFQEHKNMPQASFFPAAKETMLPKDTFKNKIVFISGGGTGLGKGMANKFSDLGATVVIASRRLNVLEEAATGNC